MSPRSVHIMTTFCIYRGQRRQLQHSWIHECVRSSDRTRSTARWKLKRLPKISRIRTALSLTVAVGGGVDETSRVAALPVSAIVVARQFKDERKVALIMQGRILCRTGSVSSEDISASDARVECVRNILSRALMNAINTSVNMRLSNQSIKSSVCKKRRLNKVLRGASYE